MKKHFKNRKCRGEKGSQADIVVEELQEKDTAAAKSTKIKHSVASEIDDLEEYDNDDSDSDYQEVQKKRKKKKKRTVQPSADETITNDTSEDEDDKKDASMQKKLPQLKTPPLIQKSHLKIADISARTFQMKHSIRMSWVKTARSKQTTKRKSSTREQLPGNGK